MGDVWSCTIQGSIKLFKKQGRLEDAESLLRESLATLAGLPTSDEACETILSMELGIVLHCRGDLLGAEKLFRGLLPKLKKESSSYGATYGYVAHNLGLVLKQRGLVTESRKYLDIAKVAQSESHGAQHERTQTSRQLRNNLDAPLRTCAHCGPITDATIVMKVCQGCKAARYCSPACSVQHWRAHKPQCKRIKAETLAVNASSDGAGPSNA